MHNFFTGTIVGHVSLDDTITAGGKLIRTLSQSPPSAGQRPKGEPVSTDTFRTLI